MPYSEDDMLMLSGVQHYVFCPRQWALIHIDQEWQDNFLTIEGEFQHKNVDNPEYRGVQRDVIVLRRVSLCSAKLGIYGLSDLIELHEVEDKTNSIFFEQFGKCLKPYPIEYKHGKPKMDDCDIMQLVCQVMCLEEKYSITIDEAALFYWKTRRRMRVAIDDALREQASNVCTEMHETFHRGCLPAPPEDLARCRRCSLIDVCEPMIHKCQAASTYLTKKLYEETS